MRLTEDGGGGGGGVIVVYYPSTPGPTPSPGTGTPPGGGGPGTGGSLNGPVVTPLTYNIMALRYLNNLGFDIERSGYPYEPGNEQVLQGLINLTTGNLPGYEQREALANALIDFGMKNPNNKNAVIKIIEYVVKNNKSPESMQIANGSLNGYMDINNKFIFISPDTPITNMTQYLQVFNLSQSAYVTIYVDQPIANSELVISSQGVGHTFIGITQGANRRIYGFYPSGTASPVFPSDPSVMGNDSSHVFDVSITIPISASVLQQIVNLSKTYPSTYNLNSYNCSNFGIDIANLCGMNFPPCQSSWGVGSGSNPARLGQYIRDTYPLNGYYDVNKNGGTAPANSN